MRLVGHTIVAVRKPSVAVVGNQLAASVVVTSAIKPSITATSIVAASFGLVAVVEVGFAGMDWQFKVMRIKVKHILMVCTEQLEEHTLLLGCILVQLA